MPAEQFDSKDRPQPPGADTAGGSDLVNPSACRAALKAQQQRPDSSKTDLPPMIIGDALTNPPKTSDTPVNPAKTDDAITNPAKSGDAPANPIKTESNITASSEDSQKESVDGLTGVKPRGYEVSQINDKRFRITDKGSQQDLIGVMPLGYEVSPTPDGAFRVTRKESQPDSKGDTPPGYEVSPTHDGGFRVTTSTGSQQDVAKRFGLVRDIPGNFEDGQQMHIHFFASSPTSSPMFVEIYGKDYPYPPILRERIQLTPEGQEYNLDPFAFKGKSGITFRFGEQPGVIEMKDIRLTSDSSDRSQTSSDAARPQGQLDIKVVDKDGNPIVGANVRIQQKFLFGTEVQGLNPDDPSPDQKRYQKHLRTFNGGSVTDYFMQESQHLQDAKLNGYNDKDLHLTPEQYIQLHDGMHIPLTYKQKQLLLNDSDKPVTIPLSEAQKFLLLAGQNMQLSPAQKEQLEKPASKDEKDGEAGKHFKITLSSEQTKQLLKDSQDIQLQPQQIYKIEYESWDKQAQFMQGQQQEVKFTPAEWPHYTPRSEVPETMSIDEARKVIDDHLREEVLRAKTVGANVIELNEFSTAYENTLEDDKSSSRGADVVKHDTPTVALARAIDIINECDPTHQLKIMYNDYQNGQQEIDMLDKLQKDHPKEFQQIDRIGIQMHMDQGNWPMEKVHNILDQFSKYDKPLYISEISVLSGAPRLDRDKPPSDSDPVQRELYEKQQADYVEKLYTTLYNDPHVHGITWWDLTDHQAWKEAPRGLLDEHNNPKPAFDRVRDFIKHHKVDVHAAAGNDGTLTQNVPTGKYNVTVTQPDGKTITREVIVDPEHPETVTIITS